MSFNQFSINRLSTDDRVLVNESDRATVQTNGSAIINSSLSSPLTGSTYCRQFVHSADHINYGFVTEVKSLISPSVQGGVFVDTNNAYALSLRAKVRMEGQFNGFYNGGLQALAGKEQNNYIGLTSYAPLTVSGSENNGLVYSGGYELVLSKGTGNQNLTLSIRSGQGLTSYSPDPLSNNFILNCSGSYSMGEWYHIRMDVIPASLTQKTINAYTSSDNGASWGLVGTAVISGAPFRNTGYNGFISSTIVKNYNDGYQYKFSINKYIDDFEAYVST